MSDSENSQSPQKEQKRGRGRPRVILTEEEKKERVRMHNKKYYSKHSDQVKTRIRKKQLETQIAELEYINKIERELDDLREKYDHLKNIQTNLSQYIKSI